MKLYSATIDISNGKYLVTDWPFMVQASSLPVAFTRAARAGLKQWKKNGHKMQPPRMNIRLTFESKLLTKDEVLP
jgi:hypothetical protein